MMIELDKKAFKIVAPLTASMTFDKVYPMSILDNYQDGRVFVDSINNPTAALFWHYCGYGYLAGCPDKEFLLETAAYIREEKEDNQKRLALQTNNPEWDEFFSKQTGIVRFDRYRFRLKEDWNVSRPSLPENMTICPLNGELLKRLQGMVIPSFSWKSDEDFLEKGMGFAVMCGEDIAASAFSAAISETEIDIGIQTNEKYRKMGLAKAVAYEMIMYAKSVGKAPLWECISLNVGSKATADGVGFKVVTTTPMFKKQQ